MNKVRAIAVSWLLSAVGCAMTAWASDPIGVDVFVHNQATFHPFSVKTDHDSPIDFRARAGSDVDFLVRQHTYGPFANTGWHMHPGPVFITVKTGTLWFYEYDDPTCTPIIVQAGGGYVDDGHGHIAVNPSFNVAVDDSVIVGPVGGPFRINIPLIPEGRCGFQ